MFALWRIMPGRHLEPTPSRVAFRRPWPTTRRGLKLWLFATIIGIKGVGYATATPSDTALEALAFPLLLMPLRAWGVLIVVLSLYAASQAYCHHGRDRYGYVALTSFAGAWGACFLCSWLLLNGPGAAIQGVATWFLIGLFAWYSSGDADSTIPMRPCRSDRR